MDGGNKKKETSQQERNQETRRKKINDETRKERACRLLFETLWYLQKKNSYTTLYYLSILLSSLHTMYYAVNDHFGWDHDVIFPWTKFLVITSLPVYKMDREEFYGVFAVAAFLLVAALLTGYHVASCFDDADSRFVSSPSVR
eukprot:TRINITY_DN10896_c0_g1::TRINITY_DN10896_c0_g1_i1::g.9833::m.9833 TRINITY_DN10896_c0_g1::TRINITY_DN10896_c0_g1_i1::g.9833  ORF type:complete len:143 (+),score=25.16,DUF3961/PF13106.1/4.9e+02,DUF3961/PF13106.1/0.095,Bac_small_YrzI/PF09501.5/1.3 TRINITY_DN10896_c0_g1_i1:196-624(+)